MRKVLLFSLLIFATLVSNAINNRTGFINTGQTTMSTPMTFSAATDIINTSETVTIIVQSNQLNPSKQEAYATLSTISGSPSVAVKLWGKCFSGDTYVQIGTTQTWTSSGNNPVRISATAPNQYRYYKMEFVASGAAQSVNITAFDLKLFLCGGLASSGTLTDGTATITGGAISGATTAAFSGAISANGGLALGAGYHLTGSSTSNITWNTNKFTVAGATGNTLIAGTLAVTGAQTNTGLLTANGNIVSNLYNFCAAAGVAGTGDVITLDFTPDLIAYAIGLQVTFIAKAANTTNVTVSIDGQGAKAIGKYNGAYAALVANDIRVGQICTIMYDGTNFVLMSPKGN